MSTIQFLLVLYLAVFETGLCQQEVCQADVVVTSQLELRNQIRGEISTVFQDFSLTLMEKLGATNTKLDSLKNVLTSKLAREDGCTP
jgi:hypothetical protein